MNKKKILLHICCAGCGVYVSKLLKQDYDVVLYFYNSNIFPESEHDKRLKETKIISEKFNLDLIVKDYNHDEWKKLIKGHEKDYEKGERCLICYKDRLENTAKFASKNKFDYFTTTLTISPHKDAKAISAIGKKLEKKYNIIFLNQDFKKQDGFKKSSQLSRELNLYRQNYCGCEYSCR